LTQAKLVEMSIGSSERSLDQPVKVIPFSNDPPASVGGYFTQQKFIWGKMPEEMQAILGIFASSEKGACVLEFAMPLGPRDFEIRAYSYLPDGKEYKPNPKEKMYLPGKGAPHSDVKGSSSSQQTVIQSNIRRGKHLIHKSQGLPPVMGT